VLFGRMPMGLLILDRELRVRHCNPTWANFIARYTKRPVSDVRPGVRLFDLVPGTEEKLLPLFERALAGETIQTKGQYLKSDDGVGSYWDAAIVPLVEDGVVTGLIDIVIDATDRVLGCWPSRRWRPRRA
jgi:PAS domain-containing protein